MVCTNTVDTMEQKTLSRRKHSAELKAQVLDACRQPGASIAAIALAHGLNANLVHKWRRHATRPVIVGSPTVEGFVALPVQPALPPAGDIRIELRRGAVTMNVIWPMAAADDCARWLRELLR